MKAVKINKTTVSAPGKLMLLGDHAVVHGFPCLVTAVDFRISAEVSIINHNKDTIDAPQAKDTQFVEETLKLFKQSFGIRKLFSVKTEATFSKSFGLGGSSAVTVAVAFALSKLCNVKLSQKELFDFCYKVVLNIQGVGSGFDIAAAIYGGTIYFMTGGKEIKPIVFNPPSFIVGYSGQKGNTAEIVKKVTERYKKDKKVGEIFKNMREIVFKGKEAAINNDHKLFGRCMIENHKLLQDLGVSTLMLDKMTEAALDAGAFGAKLSGAGGGDCMIAVCSKDKEENVKKMIESVGGTIINVYPNASGVRVRNETY